ncbi:hypothetical protein JFK97_11020 [Chromobacterium phragmitis]|uniref:hypothetical protein n=1 Tax=Chromobacterium amazonense TaxID=1382803 RepID=UPI0021B81BD3|nr:hypothetical protein [Chromobacterium amazonense]MBM2884919.1 hypothetical protein [Chromobacterium amazonense]MDE1714734.1 hypothetical protein [Chromobacterium amazonense]
MNAGILRAAGGLLLLGVWVGSMAWAYEQGGQRERLEWQLKDATREASQTKADFDAYRQEAERLHGLSRIIESKLDALRDAQPKIIERYNRVVEKNPLPADCRPGPDRLRELNAAIEAANAAIAGESVKEVQADREGGGG